VETLAPVEVPPDETPAPVEGPGDGGGAGSAAPFAPVATALPVAQASARNCPEGTGCDICQDGPIVDDSIVVTITVPGSGNSETATCGEWLGKACALEDISNCAEYQNALIQCCTTAAATKSIDGSDLPTAVPIIISTDIPTPEPNANILKRAPPEY
jgi:hypothetical protein